jgi:WXG100 family type VII secretion target
VGTITRDEFRVDLEHFRAAIATVRNDSNSVYSHSYMLKQAFREVQSHWDGPAGNTFDNLKPAFDHVLDEINALLEDILTRMQQTYDNYVAAEEDNANNFK